MRVDNSRHVIAAARQRSEGTRRRAVTALRHLDTTGTPVTFEAVAKQARVSRSWLYNQPDLRAEIERLRQRQQPVRQRLVPDRQRASEASLRQRLEVATTRIRHLEVDNKLLRDALAEALGEQRAAAILATTATRREDEFPRSSNPAEHPRQQHRPHHVTAGHSNDHFQNSR